MASHGFPLVQGFVHPRLAFPTEKLGSLEPNSPLPQAEATEWREAPFVNMSIGGTAINRKWRRGLFLFLSLQQLKAMGQVGSGMGGLGQISWLLGILRRLIQCLISLTPWT